MRFNTVTFVVLAIVASQVSGRVLHQFLGRATSDVCASLVNTPLSVKIGDLPHVTIGIINTCLCISGIPGFMASNIVAIAAVAVAGQASTSAALNALINSASGHTTCMYPDHLGATICTASNVCGFSCKDGFSATPTVRPTACTCAAPNIVCNGKCVSAAACPSSVPVKRDSEYAKRHTVCEKGHMACAVDGVGSWECIDTMSDLESCGGCNFPLTPGTQPGLDCTTIQGVSDVACVAGKCVVGRCLAGHSRSWDKSYCMRDEDIRAALDNSVLTSSYGLEHMPPVNTGN